MMINLNFGLNRPIALALLAIAACSCYRVCDKIEPRVCYEFQERHFESLKSAFPPLTVEERHSDWGKEMAIAAAFVEEFDLYRAVSTYKRAQILIPLELQERRLEIQYDILLCFFLGKRWEDVIDSFEKSSLAYVDKSFPAYHDLLLILYEGYRELDDPEREEKIYELIEKTYPETAEKLKVSRALRSANFQAIYEINQSLQHPSYLDRLLTMYNAEKKSVAKAQGFNALLPGLGYLYIGQKTSALTAFLLNGLFIAAAVQFYRGGHLAAGIITTGFEAGWYFGGIYGAGEETKYYNERTYERTATYVLNEYNLFPVLMLQHAF